MISSNGDKTLQSAHFDCNEAPSPNDVALSDPAQRLFQTQAEPRRVSCVVPSRGFIATERFIECEVIGQGGMSVILRGFDTGLQRDVAIKVLPDGAQASATEVARLVEEARIMGRLEHPNILPVYQFGIDDRGAHFLCMKLVEGETLEETLSWAGRWRLDPDFLADLLEILLKVCDAVAFAHSRGVLHRDLKPSNVMIADFGQVYVVDWGVARSTSHANRSVPPVREHEPSSDPYGALVGTPRYMAPEQLHGQHDRVDERTDVFALGATLYQILTGQPPHRDETLRETARRKTTVTIPPPEQLVDGATVPAELSRIAVKAMSYDPEDRYRSVDEMRCDIEAFQRGTWRLPLAWYPAGSTVVAHGDAADSAYLIVEGRCVAFGPDVELRELGPGDVFGEGAVVSSKPRSASVRALTDLAVKVVTGEALSSALGVNRWVGGFVKTIAERFSELDERVRQFEHRSRTTRPPPPGKRSKSR